jgi:hypothetical protein
VTEGRTAPVRAFAVAFGLLFLLSTAWIFATPLMGSPDEPAHAIKAAAVARGQWTGQQGQVQGAPLAVQVPEYIAALPAQGCFAFDVTKNPTCAAPLSGFGPQLTTATTTAGNYNPMYYSVVGLPTLVTGGAKAVFGMRLVSALVTSLFCAAALAALTRIGRGRIPLIAGTVAVTPMFLFLTASVNPNSLEVATAACVFAGLCVGLLHGPSSRWAWLLFGVSSAVLANTRAASLLWLALAALAAVGVVGIRPAVEALRHRIVWISLAITTVGCVLALLWMRAANSFESLTGASLDDPPGLVVSWMLDRTFDHAAGYVAHFGWLDTKGPSGVLVVWSALIVAALVAAAATARRGPAITIMLLIAAIIAIPVALQVAAAPQVGYIWQGRYILALVAVLILACGVALRDARINWSGSMGRVASSALGLMVFGHVYAFEFTLRRYVVGLTDGGSWGDMVSAPLWQPPGGWILLSAGFMTALVVAAVVVRRALAAQRPAE